MLPPDRLAAIVRDSLFVLGCGYEVDGDVLRWRGTRPSPIWHVHGWIETKRRMLVGGKIVLFTLLKRRWRRNDRSGPTVHSRPPDDLGTVYDSLVVAVELWCWLDLGLGLHRYATPHDDGPHRRTVQRWLRRALPRALDTQQAIRAALIERCEPRPVEMLFPGGLSPPSALIRRRWKNPVEVTTLWRGFYLLFGGVDGLDLSTAPLLAEARGRLADPTSRFLV